MKSKKWKFIVLSILVVSAAVFWAVKTGNNKNSSEKTTIINPVYGNIQTFVATTGTVLPQNRLEVKPAISGRVEKILVQEGDQVKKGQTVAWMSSTERAALLDAARAQGDEVVKQWQEVYKSTPLIAPIDGEVIVKSVEPGQTVTTNDAILVFSDRLIVQAQFDETDIGKIKKGQPAMITLDAYPDIKVNGAVNHIYYESQVVSNVSIYKVDILPDKVPAEFRSGMTAEVKVLEASRENVVTLPLEAVKQNKEGSYVLLNQGKEQKPGQRRIKTGLSNDSDIEILSGLSVADRVVVQSATYTPAVQTATSSNPFIPNRPGQRNRTSQTNRNTRQ
jgi:membrane fusion protein, macrolide-specific efflux system